MKARIVVLLVVSFASTSFGLTRMGPPAATKDQGEWDLDLSAVYSSTDMVAEATDTGVETTIESFDMFSALVGGSYGLVTDRVEVFARVGYTDMEDLNGDFSGGVGGRITTNLGREVSWGIVGQAMYFQGDDCATFGGVDGDADLEITVYQIAAGPCWHSDSLCVYGGPFAYFISGDLWAREEITGTIYRWDVEEDTQWGGYAGIEFEIKGLDLNIEYQLTPDSYCIGGGIACRF
jgi:hypothetical protein